MTTSHPVLTAEQLAAIEEQLHGKQIHPLYEYTSCTADTREGLQPPVGKYWEPNEVFFDSSDPANRNGALPNWERYYRRTKIGTPLVYNDDVIETIQMAAVGEEIHPWFEYQTLQVIFDEPLHSQEPLNPMDLLYRYGDAIRDADREGRSWALNRLHATGGFTITARTAIFSIYRRLPEYT